MSQSPRLSPRFRARAVAIAAAARSPLYAAVIVTASMLELALVGAAAVGIVLALISFTGM